MCREEGCINCLCSSKYEDLDEESQKEFTDAIFNLSKPIKVSLTFFETVAEGIIKFNDKKEVIIESEGRSCLLCDLMEFVIGFKVIKDESKSIKVNEISKYIAGLPD
jgi:hypothetical protein